MSEKISILNMDLNYIGDLAALRQEVEEAGLEVARAKKALGDAQLEAATAAATVRASEESDRRARTAELIAARATMRSEAVHDRARIMNDPSDPAVEACRHWDEIAGHLGEAAREQASAAAHLVTCRKMLESAEEQAVHWARRRDAHKAAREAKLVLSRDLAVERDCRDAARAFATAALEEILAEISDEANSAMEGVRNVRGVTVQFTTEKSNQKGEQEPGIVPRISVRGNETDASGLSGGMQTMLDLAVDLVAVGEVSARRTGFSPGWMILDESFDGMASEDREHCLEMLERIARDRLVLVVTHMQELREKFPRRLLVEQAADGSSSVRWA